MTTQDKLDTALQQLAKAELALIKIKNLSDSKAHVRSDRATLELVHAHAEAGL